MWNFFETGTGKPAAGLSPPQAPLPLGVCAKLMCYRYRYTFGRLVAIGTPWGQSSDQGRFKPYNLFIQRYAPIKITGK